MIMNFKTWLLFSVFIVIIISIIIFYYLERQKLIIEEVLPISTNIPFQELPVAIFKPATGDINDVVKAILADIPDEQAFFNNVEKDIELIIIDSQALNNFGQFYDNEF